MVFVWQQFFSLLLSSFNDVMMKAQLLHHYKKGYGNKGFHDAWLYVWFTPDPT